MKLALLIISSALLAISCNLPEHYFDEVPACKRSADSPDPKLDLSYESQAYFRNILKDRSPQEFRYFFEEFRTEGDQSFIVTNFRNENYCFSMKVLVEDWSKLEGMKKANSEGYPKELFDLVWVIEQMNGEEEIIYRDMHAIID